MIQAPIEFAWNFFYGDLEKKKMIFPKVMDEEIIKQNGKPNWINHNTNLSKWKLYRTI